jgi:polyferredoxin
MSLPRYSTILVVVALLAGLSLVGTAQGFGDANPAFGSTESEREFESPTTSTESGDRQSPYFLHDQLTKLLLVIGWTLAAWIVVRTRRFRLRRWMLLASVLVLGFIVGGLLCPISAVQNVFLKISTGYLLLFLVPTVTAILTGRLFCGYVCPFGALQELLHVPRLRQRIPDRWMKGLRFLPYAILIYLVSRVLVTGILTWNGTTPFKAFFTFGGTPLTLGISALFVVASVFVFRPFCRLLCPLGAWLSLVSRFGLFHVRTKDTCVSCGRCDTVCSSGAIESGRVHAGSCLLCGACIKECPTDALCP